MMNLTEIEGRVAALKESLAIDAVDAIWDDSFALGQLGKRIRGEIHTDGESYDYACDMSKHTITAIVDTLVGEYACGNL
jgi:hypothetical protein